MDNYRRLNTRISIPPTWSLERHRRELSLLPHRVVVIDTETISLIPSEGSVTEIGWFDLGAGVGGSFIPPHDLTEADPVALQISRYEERIAGKPTDETQIMPLHELLTNAIVVASNPQFDKNHLNELFLLVGLSPDPWQRRHVDVGAAAYWFSERTLARPTGLADAAELFNIDNSSHHDAFADALGEAELWHALEARREQLVFPDTAIGGA